MVCQRSPPKKDAVWRLFLLGGEQGIRNGSFATAAGGRGREQKELSRGQNFETPYRAFNKILGTAMRNNVSFKYSRLDCSIVEKRITCFVSILCQVMKNAELLDRFFSVRVCLS